jgi:cytochrome c553
MRAVCKRLVAACAYGVLASHLPAVGAASGAPPTWAYPVNPPADANEPPLRLAGELRHVPDSRVTFSNAEVDDLFLAPDWHPEEHVSAPEVVAHGRPPAVYACGYCHRITGTGGPENAALAGLPESYILRQLEDYRSGARTTLFPSRVPQAFMIALAKSLTPEDARAAAGYFSSLKPSAHIHVVEASFVPRTHVEGWRLAADRGRGRQAIGQRVVELPDSPADFESRDTHATFTAYVPPGSIASGSVRVREASRAGTPACVFCHGEDLRGSGAAPPLAGRSPTYLVRQLVDMQTGVRAGPNAQMMKTAIAGLTLQESIAIAAYAASLEP